MGKDFNKQFKENRQFTEFCTSYVPKKDIAAHKRHENMSNIICHQENAN